MAGQGVLQEMSGTSYFSEYKKGEVNDLRQQLQEAMKDRDSTKLRDGVKKVIAFMTAGIDVSSLFPDMIMATNTTDFVQKKLAYLYLCSFAGQNKELSLLTVNTLQKDFGDSSPMVRGLALKAICSLRNPELLEYILPCIKTGLLDVSPHVRKTAVMGCAKIFQIAPATIKDNTFVHKLYEMIRDKDPAVIINAVYALNEILKGEGGIALNDKIIVHLVTNLQYMDEWSQCNVLELISGWQPPDQDAVFPILNSLDARLKSANAGVILGVIKLFFNYTQEMPEVHAAVFARAKEPLLSTLSGASAELTFTILKHVQLLIPRAPQLFAEDYKRFYCKYNEFAYIKLLKLEVLKDLAPTSAAQEIIDELSEYALETNQKVARKAIECIGKIGLKVPQVCSRALEKMLIFLNMEIPHIQAKAAVMLRDLLRKYPAAAEQVVPHFNKTYTFEEADTKAAFIWILGEYGESIVDSPYMLEDMAKEYAKEQPEVKLQLLSSAMKLFFKRPAEVRPALGIVLEAGVSDDAFPDVHDRALLYYRLLQRDINEARRVVLGESNVPIQSFIEETGSLEISDKLFEEFNTLSVIYGKLEEHFMDQEEEEDEEYETAEESDYEDEEVDEEAVNGNYDIPPQTAQTGAAYAAPDLLSTPIEQTTGAGMAPTSSVLQLVPGVSLNPKTYQQLWKSWPKRAVFEMKTTDRLNTKKISSEMKKYSIALVASGVVKQSMKFYMSGKSSVGEFLLAEVIINLQESKLNATIKSEQDGIAQQFASHIQAILQNVV